MSDRFGILLFVPCSLMVLLSLGPDTSPRSTRVRRPASHAPAARQTPAADAAARRAGADAGWMAQVTAGIEREEYRASASDRGLQAPNRAQNLRTYFRASGIEVVPRRDDQGPVWRFTWRTSRWGRPGTLVALPTATAPDVDGSRVTYRRPGLTEWYENAKSGLEQGFLVARRPAGRGPLCLAGNLGTTLRVELRNGVLDLFDPHHVHVLRYGALRVTDARGREIPSRLRLEGEDLAILIEDAQAVYPITVDPLMTSPAWTAEGNQAVAFFSFSVSTAGDVNGDGYSDVIVGARGYDNDLADEGRAFVYYGSASGLPASASWTAEGNQTGAVFGWSVACAGDVNGDGYSDVIVGAPQYSNGQTSEGRAFVFLGSGGGLALTPAWTAESDVASAQLGASVAGAGDVNGDGYADVVVGAPNLSNGQSNEGRAYLYQGSAGGLALTSAWTVESNVAGALYGTSVASAGDVNADAYGDVIVGAPQFSNGQTNEGLAFVYQGSVSGLVTTPAWIAESNQSDALFAYSVAGAGDVNGDGYSDVIVGARLYDNGQTDEGREYAYYGSAAGLSVAANWIVESNQSSATLGFAVAAAGDINGDGFADVIVSADLYDNGQSDEGRAFVYRGSAAGLESSPVWTAESDQALATFGFSVAGAGDVNGDGFSDVIVGAELYDNPETNEGRAYLYLGGSNGLAIGPSWSAESNQANALFGYSVASAGDVNGDGCSDVIVGARGYDNGQTDEGRAFVYLGSTTGLSVSPSWTAESDQAGAAFGGSVASAGDVDGNGYSDVIVGARAFDNGETDEGRAFLYLGSVNGLTASPAWTAESDQGASGFGWSVASAGDVNGDGYSDVIIGSQAYDHFFSNEGRVWLFYGLPGGLSSNVNWIADGSQAGALFGYSVACAGDVNRDGYSDVIIGAPFFDNGQTDEGGAFVFLGSAGGLSASPSWTAEGDQVGAQFGWSVAGAGDEDGDGYSDVIVGANLYDNGQTDEGRAFYYRGLSSGVDPTPSWTGESNQASAQYGFSVASAGDVNGDGYSDIVVGAADYANVDPYEGRAYVYLGSAAAAGPSPTPDWMDIGHFQADFFGSSVACAGDVNGDGYSEVIVSAPNASNGQFVEGLANL
jgi:hypothetical protein